MRSSPSQAVAGSPDGASPPAAAPDRDASRARPLALRLAPVLEVGLEGLEPELLAELERRMGAFAVDEAPGLRIAVSREPGEGYLPRGGADEVYRVECERRGDRVRVVSYAFTGEFPLSGAGEGQLRLVRGHWEAPDRSVENFLRALIAWRAPASGALLLHASAVGRRGRAYVFLGPSGAGKSTAARLSAPQAVRIADDLCLVWRGEGGAWRASGLPLRSGESDGAEGPRSWPLRALLRLCKARTTGLEPLAAARTVAELAASVPFVTETAGGADVVLTEVVGLARRVPAFQLRFRRDAGFWAALDGAAL